MHRQVQENRHPATFISARTLVVIDPRVDHYQDMVEDLAQQSVAVLEANQNGIDQITRLLEQFGPIHSLHIVSHGVPGAVFLGNSELSLATLSTHTPQLKEWFQFTDAASITLYGCNVAVGDAGEEFLHKLHELTHANIAASQTVTGNQRLGGDWNLAYRLGMPDSSVVFSEALQQTYSGTLASQVTSLITSLVNATGSSIVSNGIGTELSEFLDAPYTTTFGNGQDLILDGFVVNGETFSTQLGGLTLASTINIQRSGAVVNTPFFALENDPRPNPEPNNPGAADDANAIVPASTNLSVLGTEAQTDEDVLNGNIINRGIEAVFVNDGQSASNIERLDYILIDPVSNPNADELDSVGFLIVERGGNDSFQIAPILALDAAGNPAQYGDLVNVGADDFGETNLALTSIQMTQGPTDADLRPNNIFGTQNIAATYVSWADLGIGAGENVFGYSLFAPDTDPNNGSLLDITSGAFPTDTPGGQNSLDPIAGGLLFVGEDVTLIPLDSDEDGIENEIDLDDDDDGILDVDEGIAEGRDTDDDGIPDYLDIDSDNDGIPDNVEAQTTAGYRAPIPAGPNADTNNNGINDAYDPNVANSTPITPANLVDTDADDTPDYLDLDSDGDGLLDAQENNSTANEPSGNDADLDGLDDAFDAVDNSNGTWDPNDDINNPATDLPNQDGNNADVDYRTVPITPPPDQDTDDDGIPDIQDIDDDNDGILDVIEEDGVPNRDTDGDGVPDRLDLDTDNDGILDLEEAGHTAAEDPNNPGRVTGPFGDNGFADSLEDGPESGNPIFDPRDADNDTIPDFQDLDSDNDSIPDVTESGGNDPDEDGIIGDGTPVVNEDGVANDINPDPAIGGTPSPVPDSDGDGQPDHLDLDSDGNGTNDLDEVGGRILDPDGNGRVDGPDEDEDGITDTVDQKPTEFGTGPTIDTDNDNIPDVFDLDDDNDGILDEVEDRGTPNLDTDGDGVPDRLDLDADNDGILDIVEAGHSEGDTDGDGRVDTPVGNNGFADGLETAPDSNTANYTATNTDNDDVPDFQDLDADNDGILDVIEGGNLDPDEDGLIGNGTPTLSNNGVDANGIATARQVPVGSSFNLPDIDNDGIFDFRELDSDDDGTFDLIEGDITAPDANNDGVVDGPDTDGDGIVNPIDRQEGIFGTGPANTLDTDDDGVPDFIDLDDDNDGILDEVEENGVPGRDTDGDGVPDILDLDADNDGILDLVEAGHSRRDTDGDGRVNGPFGANGFANGLETSPESGIANYTAEDTDGDDIPDFQDLDSDNDSIPDVTESDGSDPDQDGIIGTGTPTVNEDGLANDINPTVGGTPSPVPDTDNDSIPDYRDLDTDNDGIFDLLERGGIDLPTRRQGQVTGVDSDNDGIVDSVDGDIGTFGTDPSLNPVPLDTDDDNLPDYRDVPLSITGREKIPGDQDQLFGLSDPDRQVEDSDNSPLIGGSADDVLQGRSGNNTLLGGSGDDILRAGGGRDVLNGGSGDDTLRGGRGQDVLSGGSGKDRLFGGRGRDLLSGGSQSDRLFGGRGRDILNGDRGNDRINGEGGKDILTGGQGRDIFIFDNINEIGDTITDFELTQDRIKLRPLNNGINSFADLSIRQAGDDTLVRSNNGVLIVRLNTIEAGDLDSSNFIF